VQAFQLIFTVVESDDEAQEANEAVAIPGKAINALCLN